MMVRRISLAFVVAMIISGAVARAATTNSAPADEYFGQFKYSVLEMSNRLSALESLADVDIVKPNELVALGNLESAFIDWTSHYPRDPWVPKMASGIEHCYIRAHQEATAAAETVLGVLMSAHPGSPEAQEVLTALEHQHSTLIAPPVQAVQPQDARPGPSASPRHYASLGDGRNVGTRKRVDDKPVDQRFVRDAERGARVRQ